MPLFSKQILKPGRYLARNMAGKRVEFNVTPERIDHWITNFGKMQKAGLKIPAPWKHDLTANPTTEASSKDNAGFWEKLWKAPNGSLHGQVNVPLEDDAKRVGTTVQEVSPLVCPDWTDGMDTDWKDSINHIALVQKPVVSDQDNFEPITSEAGAENLGIAASLSDYAGVLLNVDVDTTSSGKTPEAGEPTNGGSAITNATSPSIKAVIEALASVNLTLPEDTTFENLAERIVVAGKAISGTTDDDEEQNVKDQPNPVAMSEEVQKKAKEIETLTKSSEKLQAKLDHFTALSQEEAKKGYEIRISNLLKDGRMDRKFYDSKVKAMLEGFQLSVGEDGKPQSSQLDVILESIEQVPKNGEDQFLADSGTLASLQEQGNPSDFESEEGVEKTANELIKIGGLQTVVTS